MTAIAWISLGFIIGLAFVGVVTLVAAHVIVTGKLPSFDFTHAGPEDE